MLNKTGNESLDKNFNHIEICVKFFNLNFQPLKSAKLVFCIFYSMLASCLGNSDVYYYVDFNLFVSVKYHSINIQENLMHYLNNTYIISL